MTTTTTPPLADPVRAAVQNLVHTLTRERLGTGPLAELRRMDPIAGILPPDFWRVLLKHVEPHGLSDGTKAERAWAVIIHGIALMVPRSHEAKASAGKVLAETSYSEPRFVRLLRAEDEGFAKEVQIACSWLATKAQPIDWPAFARFILSRLHPRFCGGKSRDEQTHRLARAYFGALAKDTPAKEAAAP